MIWIFGLERKIFQIEHNLKGFSLRDTKASKNPDNSLINKFF